jgi:hypothetical protein
MWNLLVVLNFERFTNWRFYTYSRNCQTLRVSPAKPGAYPFWLRASWSRRAQMKVVSATQ